MKLGGSMSQWCIDGKEMYKVERCKWKFVVVNKTRLLFCRFFLPSPSSLVLLSSRNSATMLTSHFYFNICIEKADAKGWLAKMTIVMTSLPWARGFQCLFTFALVSASCWLAEIWYLNKLNLCLKLKITYSCTVAPFDANVTKEKAHM